MRLQGARFACTLCTGVRGGAVGTNRGYTQALLAYEWVLRRAGAIADPLEHDELVVQVGPVPHLQAAPARRWAAVG